MQTAAMGVISTLTHRDFIQIQFTLEGSQPRLLSSNSFLAGNSNTRTQAIALISSEEFSSGLGDLTQTFGDVIQLFSDATDSTSDIRACHRIVILFTDSELSSNLPDDIQLTQTRLGTTIDIFTYTFGGIFTNPAIPQRIACQNRGEWFQIDTGSRDPSPVVDSYYTLYAASVQTSSVVWSEPFRDILSGREVVSACLPVYDPASAENRTAVLLGVTCTLIDITRFDDFPDGQLVSFTYKCWPL